MMQSGELFLCVAFWMEIDFLILIEFAFCLWFSMEILCDDLKKNQLRNLSEGNVSYILSLFLF